MLDAPGSQHPTLRNAVQTGCVVREGCVAKKRRFARHGERLSRPLGAPYHVHMGDSVPDVISY